MSTDDKLDAIIALLRQIAAQTAGPGIRGGGMSADMARLIEGGPDELMRQNSARRAELARARRKKA